MRLVIRILGIEILAIEQGDEVAEDWSLGGTTSSAGFTNEPLPPREGYDWGEDQ